MNTQCLEIKIKNARPYRVYIGTKLLGGIGEQVAKLVTGRKACVISDSNVAAFYLEPVRESMVRAGFDVIDAIIEPGERSKDIGVAKELWGALAEGGLGRDSVILALGGGVVGDIAGFVASTYMRGISYVQLPTTLLAMVDSSVGGKTAINLSAGKNLVASFYQPILVAADLDVLKTLPEAEWVNGFAEIAKSALLEGGSFYSWLVEYCDDLRKQGRGAVQQAVVRSLVFKGRVVAADEKETNERECLNYGHTFAHALEAAAGYGGVSHGRAVAAGMRFAASLAAEALALPALGLPALAAEALALPAAVEESFANKQAFLLEALGLEDFPDAYSADELFDHMLADKKARANELRFVFVTAPGQWQTCAVDVDLVKIHLILWEQARL